MRSHFTAFLVCLLGLPCVLTAQAGKPATPPALTAALTAYAATSSDDAVARGNALRRLAMHDDPRVTEILLTELRAARDDLAAEVIVRMIGSRARDGVFDELRRILLRDNADLRLRRAAAEGIGRQGNMGIDLLLDLALGDGAPSVRNASIDGLGAAKDERAWRGLASLSLSGPATERLRILRLLEGARDIAAVTKAREHALAHNDLQLAALAWRQLVQEGYAKAEDALDDLLDKAGDSPLPAVRADLVLGMAEHLVPARYAAFVALAADDALVVRTATRRIADVVTKDQAFVEWLAGEGLRSNVPAERDCAIRLLRAAPPAAVVAPLAPVRERLRKPTKETLALAVELHDLLARDPTWKTEVLQLVRSRDPWARTAGLQMLLELQSGEGVAEAQASIGAREWELRSVAYRYLGVVRDPGSIALLIGRVGTESGRLDGELNDSLFLLTGRRFWRRADWERWWHESKEGFMLPPLQSVQNSGSKKSGATVSYFDIPLVSNRVVFLIDVSGSMQAPIGTDQKRTRLDEAKFQLRRVVEALPDTFLCNAVFFETKVTGIWDRLQRARGKQKQELLAKVDPLKPLGGTNIHDALELAFKDPDIDTIYLLTDGQPSAGKIVDVNDLADQVRAWNRTRQIVIHGIAVGTDSPLLKRLAAESGGEYVLRR